MLVTPLEFVFYVPAKANVMRGLDHCLQSHLPASNIGPLICKESGLGHWLDLVYPLPLRGKFVDHIFLEAQYLARIFQHVSPLKMAA